MTRTVNFRPLFYLFLAFALGIAFAYYIFTLNLVVISLAVILALIVILLSVFNKKYKQLIAVLVAFIVGLGAFAIDFATYINKDYAGARCEVVGRVDEFSLTSSNYSYVTLTNVKINGNPSKNISLSIQSQEEVDLVAGNILSFETEIYSVKLFDNGWFDSYRYKKDVGYVATVEFDDLKIESGGKTLAESIRFYIKDILDRNMSSENANLAYSALFGDKTELDKTLKENFSVAGVAHLLAVSGLHIGFLVAIIFWLLKRFNCKGIKRFIIIAIFLLFYSYLCDFTPSVVRASLMCLTFLLMDLIRRNYDILSSIGLSGILILCVHPLYVFDAGFLMSFCSVLAIAMLYKVFAKIFVKIKIPKPVAETIAVDVSTTIAIAPILAIYFENLSFLSFVTNLICIPLFSFGYSLLFIFVILVCIFNFLGFLLLLPELLFKLIVIVVEFIASIDWAIMPLKELSNFGLVLFYLILFIISPMLMLKAGKKFVLVLCIFVITINASSAFMNAPPPTTNSYSQLNTNNPCTIIQSKSGEIFMLASGKDISAITEYLVYKRIYKVDTFFLTSPRNEHVDFLERHYEVDNILTKTFGTFTVGAFTIESFNLGSNEVKAVYIETDNTGFLIGLEYIGSNQAQILLEKVANRNIKVVYQPKEYGYYEVTNADYLLSNYKINTYSQQNFSTKVRGSFTFEFKDGIIEKIRSIT